MLLDRWNTHGRQFCESHLQRRAQPAVAQGQPAVVRDLQPIQTQAKQRTLVPLQPIQTQAKQTPAQIQTHATPAANTNTLKQLAAPVVHQDHAEDVVRRLCTSCSNSTAQPCISKAAACNTMLSSSSKGGWSHPAHQPATRCARAADRGTKQTRRTSAILIACPILLGGPVKNAISSSKSTSLHGPYTGGASARNKHHPPQAHYSQPHACLSLLLYAYGGSKRRREIYRGLGAAGHMGGAQEFLTQQHWRHGRGIQLACVACATRWTWNNTFSVATRPHSGGTLRRSRLGSLHTARHTFVVAGPVHAVITCSTTIAYGARTNLVSAGLLLGGTSCRGWWRVL